MLKLTVKAGEYVLIGDDIKVIFTGGSSHNLHVLVEAPKSYAIARSKVLKKDNLLQHGMDPIVPYYRDPTLSKESMQRIKAIIMEDKKSHSISGNNEKA